MNKKRSRGQIQLSFGMVFSIIIIIATLAITGYIIVKFLNTETNVSCKLVYSDLQNKVNTIWHESFTSDVFSRNAPREVKQVCFGNLTQRVLDRNDDEEYNTFKDNARTSGNMFFYPNNICDEGNFDYAIKHAITESFFCIPVKNGKFSVKMDFDVKKDKLVRLSKIP